MYHPSAQDEASVDGSSLEWIELYNEDPTVRHLSGCYFSEGVDFVFPADVYLEGRSYLVVCADEDAVHSRYGITNTIGNFTLRLENNGETIALNILGGGPEIKFGYSDRNQWPQAADGTGHSLVLKDPFLDPSDNDNWTWSTVMGGTPGGPNFDEPTIKQTVLLESGSDWRYNDSGNNLGTSWRGPDFDDAGWARGPGQLGYGDGDEATVLSFGDDGGNKYITYYFRRTLEIEDPDAYDSMDIRLMRDDGAVVYVNGNEVARTNLPAGTINFDTRANTAIGGGDESAFNSFGVPASVFVPGTNVLTVEIHQANPTSSDISFDLELAGITVLIPSPVGEPVPVVINECLSSTDGERWIELYNTSRSLIDLSGFHLSDERNDLGKHTLAEGSTIDGHGYLILSEAQTGLNFTGTELFFYLSRPDLSQVIDAQVFDALAEGRAPAADYSLARNPDGTGRFFVSTTPTRGAPNEVLLQTNVVINEIMYHPPRERGVEFVELYNAGTEPVDMSGCRLNRGINYTFPDGTELPAGQYIVVTLEKDTLGETYGLPASQLFGPASDDMEARESFGQLSDTGELVRLVDRLGNLMDEIRYYDSGRWSRWADGGGSSLELMDPTQDNSVASAWEASDESGKSEWEEVTYNVSYTQQQESEFQIRMLDAADVLIDDIRVVRGGTNYLPNGSFESNTLGWIIEGNHGQSHRTTEDAYAGNACLKIVATGDGDTRVNRIERETSPVMNSGTYTVSLALRWLRGGNLIYFSSFRQTAQHTHWMPYPERLGTPGARNSRAVANLGPVISGVRHSPPVPGGGVPVSVVARVTDSDGVTAVTARHRVRSAAGVFSSVDLFDDGVHGDGEAGDGLYGGTIPGETSGTKVVYYVHARDSQGAERTYPREAPGRTLTYLHSSPFTANASFTYRLVHDEATWNELNTRRLHSNELLDATFVFNESKVYYNVGTRYRGSPWNRPGTPRMYRVKFNRDDLYRGRNAINLSRYGNAQRERAAYYAVWRNSTATATTPLCRSAFARVQTNAGTWSMEHIEPVNRDFLKLWFPHDDDGILMKITGKQVFDDNGNHLGNLIQWANWSNRGSNKANYRWNFNHRTRELEDDFSPLVALVQRMNSNNPVIDNQLDDIMDVEQFLRVYAARCAHDDWDTISIGNGQNAYVYYAMREGRWKLLAWDMDHTWGNVNARLYPDADGTMSRIVNRPKWRRLYQGILEEMVGGRGTQPGFWTEDEMVSKFLDRITAVVGTDGVGNADGIRSYIRQRTGRLSGQVPGFVPFAITTNNGEDFTVDSQTTPIEGNAWVDVRSIVVNDTPAELTWITSSRWRTTVDLEGGDNLLRFFAFDVEGDVIGSDEIGVTSTVGWRTPTISEIAPPEAMPGETVTITGTDFHAGIEAIFSGTLASTDFDEEQDPTSLTAEVPFLPPGPAEVSVRNVDQRTSDAFLYTVAPLPPHFIRGDVNLDEVVDISDPVRLLRHLFAGVDAPCRDAGDVDNNEMLEVTDAVIILDHLFRQGPPPPAPYPEPGREDETEGPLGCEEGVDIYD